MLQPHLRPHPVHVAKLEQPPPYYRRHPPAQRNIRRPHRTRLTVNEIQQSPVVRDSAWLGQRRRPHRPVVDVLPSTSRVRPRPCRQLVQTPYLMRPCHRRVHHAPVHRQVPRRIQPHLAQRSSPVAERPLAPVTRHRVHVPVLQVHPPNGVILRIRHVQNVAPQRHSLRMVERRHPRSPRPRTPA